MNKGNKLIHLEGLRGFAAFVVLMVHLRNTFFIDLHARIVNSYGLYIGIMIEGLFDGTFAVWLFWVMSAFVLSLKYHETKDPIAAQKLMTDSALRRYPRLAIPAFASVLFGWALLAMGLMSNKLLADQFGDNYSKWLGTFYQFSPSILDAFSTGLWESFFAYQTASSYNTSLWTMQPEFYGSLILFSTLSLFGKFKRRYFIYVSIMIAARLLKLNWINAFIMGNILSEWYVFHAQANNPSPLTTTIKKLASSKILFGLLIMPTLFAIGLPDFKELTNLFLAVLVTFYVCISEPAIAFFSTRTLAFLGKISFGLYLIHFPIICATAYPLYNFLLGHLGDTNARIASWGIITIISILGGWILWFVADRPAIAISRWFSKWLSNSNGKILEPSSQNSTGTSA